MNFGFGISNVAFVECPRGGRSFSRSAQGRRGASSSTVRDPWVVISGYPFAEFQIRRLQQRLLPLNHKSKIRNSGFTLTELLVVIALMVFLMILAWPALGLFTASTRLEGAVNGVSVAAQVMRVINGQPRITVDSPNAHNGTAIIFLPLAATDNVEIHWTQNYDVNTTAISGQTVNLYQDYDTTRPPVKLSKGMTVAGIMQPRQTGRDYLVAPPFAVRFDAKGILCTSKPYIPSTAKYPDVAQRVYYDLNSNPTESPLIKINSTIAADRSTSADSSLANNNEWLPCVIGLVVYARDMAVTEGLVNTATDVDGRSYLAPKDTTTVDDLRLKAQGRVIFFNRYSGAASIEGVQ